MAGLALTVAMNVVGLNVGKWLTNVGAIAGWIPAMLLMALGAIAWSRFGSATPITGARARAEHAPEGHHLLVDDRVRLRRRRERIDDGRGDSRTPGGPCRARSSAPAP